MAQSILQFIESRKPRWDLLEKHIRVLEKGKAKKLKSKDLKDIGRLYREATADLSRLQAFRKSSSPPEDLEIYLNNLVARAYGQIYRAPSPGWGYFWEFLRFIFPKVFRQTSPWFCVATGIFLLGALYGFVAAITDESFIPLIVPTQMIQKVEDGKVWFDSILAIRPLASSMIMTNNISVTFVAFAFGITFGLGTIYIMAFNGLLLGTVAGLCYIHGLNVPFWSFVLPHGVIELTAIFISGGAGLMLGSALIAPGDLPRKDALIKNGRNAVRLILGCVPLLVVAGIIEGFFSPSSVPAFLKFSVAVLLLALLLAYLLLPSATKDLSASLPGTD